MATAPTSAGIGTPLSRVDGVAKVTGAARYAAEHFVEDLLYGVIVSSSITTGRIVSVDTAAARAVPGVVEVMTHENRPETSSRDTPYQDQVAPPGSPFKPLHDDRILFAMQPVALVLADTFEAARYAASLVRPHYEAEPHNTDFMASLGEAFLPSKPRDNYVPPKDRGDAEQAYADAPHKVSGEYHLATEHHNPMEMHATTVVWEGDGKITVYDKTQGPQNVQAYLAGLFGFKAADVRVLNPYVGGAFGSGLRPQYQVYLATLAARMLERSVKVVMTRQQMFSHVHRPEAVQNIRIAADADGRLTSIINTAITSTSRYENNMENVVPWALIGYASPNASGDYKIAPRDTHTSGDMRAPGAATGVTLFEIAMDELAYEAGVDPLAFREDNDSDIDAMNRKPFSSKELRKAYRAGADAFGWADRSPAPRSMRDGNELVGWGVATGIWDAQFSKTSASAKLSANGHLEVASAASDIGTGTYTVMTQLASETLGLAPDRISARLGDSTLPTAPVEGGSWMAVSVGYAVQLACRAVSEKLLKAAGKVDGAPLGKAGMDDVEFVDGTIRLREDPSRAVSFVDAMRAADLPAIEEQATANEGPLGLGGMVSQMRKSRHTHSAIFAEVKIDEELGVIRVTRIVNAVAAGRIINPKTARSQIVGGVVMGIGMALHEETFMDNRLGRFMNHNYAEYHIPVNADVGSIDVIFVDEHEPELPLGIKGVGEIGIVATAAAIANAIFHATGKRVRSLPITIDKLLDE
jgi:xanthine dehydrogenase YagR molybdenum-binding subunit